MCSWQRVDTRRFLWEAFGLTWRSASCPRGSRTDYGVRCGAMQVHLYTYNAELRNVPDGVVLKNACSIMADDTQNRPYK